MSTKKLIKFYKFNWSLPTWLVNIFGKLGDIGQYLGPIAVLGYCVLMANWHLLEVFTITYLITAAIQVLLKLFFNNPRPRETDLDGINPDLKLEISAKEGNSFPSGHTMSAMTGGMFWFEFIGLGYSPIIFGIAGVLVGVITAFSRIFKRAHWVRDVGFSLVVSIIAYLVAKFFFL